MRRQFAVIVCLLGAVVVASANAQTSSRKIAGEIVRFDRDVLEVKSVAGDDVRIRLSDRARVSVRGASDISHVAPGSYIGTTAAPRADGTLVASEVHIFPDSMRGTSEGHHAMSGSDTMTNATVTNVAGAPSRRDTMTNATVANVASANGERTLMLAYKGGEKTVVVPSGTPVMTYDTGDRSLLVPGAHVIVYAAPQDDGALVSERVTVGRDGYVPPS